MSTLSTTPQTLTQWRAVAIGGGDGWQQWTPRDEIATQFTAPAIDADPLEVHGCGAACYGAWRRRVDAIREGAAYRFTASCRHTGIAQPARSIFARLAWLDAKGERLRPLDNAAIVSTEGGVTDFEHLTLAPAGARTVVIEVGLRWSDGTVRWDDVRLDEADALPARPVRIVTIYHRPRDTRSREASVAQFCDVLACDGCAGADIICLPEGVSVIGTGKGYADVAESIPGPTTSALAEVARRQRAYVVAGLYERDAERVYNTAVLIDRDGQVIGRYRKTHLPQEEADAGLMPGDGYPVFDTDFGKVGIMICWDLQYPEPARALARAGAEIILLPIWGGSDVLAQARAIENHVYVVTSSYDIATRIIDPTGRVLAEATPEKPIAATTVDLAAPIINMPWLGDMKSRTWSERRTELG